MTLLFQRDADESEFVREARRFLSAIRSGHDDEAAATRSKVTVTDVRTWMREPAFAAAYRRARRGEGKARVIDADALVAGIEAEERSQRVREQLECDDLSAGDISPQRIDPNDLPSVKAWAARLLASRAGECCSGDVLVARLAACGSLLPTAMELLRAWRLDAACNGCSTGLARATAEAADDLLSGRGPDYVATRFDQKTRGAGV